ncbi:hypothetical protein [Streptomyces galbus]|uniref:Uncharacterized protein n=1 Tax=Streptomyces galbus TaxID=33898 RepID=A0A4U5X9Z6_STRGB|nr:hypothetical protein [Streptomyces galbus]TKT11161.1 hypothetical protein E4U92_03310 [Streptomyces galbus]
MPRRRPGALRAHRSRHPVPRTRTAPPPPRIPGLSTATTLAVHRVEATYPDFLLFPGATSTALLRYRAFLVPGRRPLYPRTAVCPSCPGCALDDVREARDTLAEVLRRLPPRPAGELASVLAALDGRYAARTLPDPRAPRSSAAWWHGRLGEGAEGW